MQNKQDKQNILLMEKSINTSRDTAITTSQESSWTKYFVSFITSQEKRKGEEEEASYSYSYSSADVAGDSIVSDAASCARETSLVGSKTVKVKRRKKGRGMMDEDPLEDTASSPVNSPKVSELIQQELSPPNQLCPPKRDANSLSKEKVIMHAEEEINTNNNIKEYTELNKRGLCLVPLSMIFENYRSNH